jgi:hypothetical protein
LIYIGLLDYVVRLRRSCAHGVRDSRVLALPRSIGDNSINLPLAGAISHPASTEFPLRQIRHQIKIDGGEEVLKRTQWRVRRFTGGADHL